MVRIALLSLVGACTPKVALEPPDPEPAPRTVRLDDPAPFFATLRVSGGAWDAAGERLLASTDASGDPDVYAFPIDGSPPRRLTEGPDAEWAVSWFPADERFLYLADEGGNELLHLYLRELDGSTTDLTPAAGARAGFLGWSEDRASFFVQTNERDPRAMDVYRYAVTEGPSSGGYPRTLLFQNDDALAIAEVRPDGRYVLLEQAHNNVDSDVLLWDAETPDRAPRLLTPHEGDASHEVFGFEPGSERVWYGTDGHGEFVEAWTLDLADPEAPHQRRIAADWDVAFVAFSETGQYRVHGVNADGVTEVHAVRNADDAPLALPDLPAGTVSDLAFSRAEDRLRFYLSSDTTPDELYVWTVGEPSARKLTDAIGGAVDPAILVASETLRYPSTDGLPIPAVLYKPIGASAANPAPALVFVHGGPGGQSRPRYNADWQALVNAGYAVLAINNRGSSGYGKTFNHLDDRRHGDADLQDCVAAEAWLASQDWVDPERIGIMGGSYGGYLTLAALAFEPEVFAVGVDIFGVANWVRTLESIPPWWTSQKAVLYSELGDPAVDAERLLARSPLAHPEGIVRPLFVVQGANDPRVLKVESDEIVAAVKANGVPVEYLVFDDEGHGFRKRDNRVEASRRILAFLDTHLAGPR